MSSSHRPDVVAAVIAGALVACGRTPIAPRADHGDTTPPPVVDATAIHDAGLTVDAQPDAPMTPSSTISAHDRAALDDSLAGLASEHREDWGPAMAWLIAHPAIARPPMADVVARGGGPADMEVERAAIVLGEIGHADDVEVLAAALSRGGEIIAWKVAQALAIHRAPAALAALIAATEADDPTIVRAATAALGTRHDDAARPAIEGLLGDPRTEVRYSAVLALIDLGPRPSRAALKRHMSVEADGEVRGAIRRALSK